MSTPIETNTEELRDILNQVNNLPERSGGSGGVELPTLNDQGAEEDLIYGKELIGADGEKVTGNMPLVTDTTGNMVISPINTLKHVMAGNNVIRNVVEVPERVAFEANSRFAIDTWFKQLPNVEPNLKIENIKKDVSVFDFVGTYEGTGDVELPTLDNPGMPEHMMEGKEYIDQNGVKRTGEFTLDAELTEQDSLISQIMTALEGKAAGGGNLSYDTCTVNISTSNIDEMRGVAYVTVNSDGEIESVLNETMASSYSLTCLCGSVVVVAVPGHVDTRLTKATNLGWLVNSNCRIYGITASKNEVATVIINTNSVGSND